jgi:hypothetical protein
MADFAGFGYTERPPLTSAYVATLLQQIEADKQRILCVPDMFEQVQAAVYGGGLGLYYTVLEHRYLRDGQVLVMQSEAEQQADLERVGYELMNSMFAAPTSFSDLP